MSRLRRNKTDSDEKKRSLLRLKRHKCSPLRKRSHRRALFIGIPTVVIGIIVACVFAFRTKSGNSPGNYIERACSVFCHGPILEAVQLSGIYSDSKTFVDMPMKEDPEKIKSAFHNEFGDYLYSSKAQLRAGFDLDAHWDDLKLLKSIPSDKLSAFVNKYFSSPESALEEWIPTDFTPKPAIVSQQANASIADWVSGINAIWKQLGRKPVQDVYDHSERYSLLPLPQPLIVPGGRFRESYYWDTYWIVLGLLHCGMRQTAEQIVENFKFSVESYRFVPNGGRIYYLQRSQPPLLSEMVTQLYLVNGSNPSMNNNPSTQSSLTYDKEKIAAYLSVLKQEYQFFMDSHAVHVSMDDSTDSFLLNHYHASSTWPRPESYAEDVASAHKKGASPSSATGQLLFQELASGAETGWDFSSRWLKNASELYSIRTMHIIPVELNTILYRVELNIALMYTILDQHDEATDFIHAANDRVKTMQQFMWNETCSCWLDLEIETLPQNQYTVVKAYQRNQITAAAYIPIWGGCGVRDTIQQLWSSAPSIACLYDGNDETISSQVISSLETSGLIQIGGVLTTLEATGQQWDKPNSWPPLNYWLIDGLSRSSSVSGGPTHARELARRWLRSSMLGYYQDDAHTMFEKYNAYIPGDSGHGGEYVPQKGFGWTNGVALDLMARYQWSSFEENTE